jgi:hypothetical protein
VVRKEDALPPQYWHRTVEVVEIDEVVMTDEINRFKAIVHNLLFMSVLLSNPTTKSYN